MNQGVLGKVKVGTYTKDDGTVVREHERKRPYSNITGVQEDQEGNRKELSSEKIKRYSKLIGLPPTIKGELTFDSFQNIEVVTFYGEGVRMVRTFDGSLVSNDEFYIQQDSPWKGQGSYFLERQVEETKNNFTHIITNASKSGTSNGYYTWPRLGFEPDGQREEKIFLGAWIRAGLPQKSFKQAMQSEKYRKAWLKEGEGFSGRFDLSKDSYSMNTLKDYNSFKRKTVKEIL